MLDYLVVYDSQSGNTEKIATSIFSALPGNSKDLIDIHSEETLPDAAVYFVGSCIHRGTCLMEVSDFLDSLQDKDIALFGTCGMGNSPEYYETISRNLSAWVDDSCRLLGTFICQGKMPRQVREKYENMRTDENAAQVEKFIQNFDSALTHPDQTDVKSAQEFVKSCLAKLS